MNEDRVKELARRIGMDALDTSIQEGAYLAKHIQKCPECAKLLDDMNKKISDHALREWA